MSRVIRPVSPASQRRKLMQRLALTLAAVENGDLSRGQRRDALAFIALVLGELSSSVEETCAAWEKRSYYLKADRFRREWNWVEQARRLVTEALQRGQHQLPDQARAILRQALAQVKIPARMRQQAPWQGAWEAWNKLQSGGQ